MIGCGHVSGLIVRLFTCRGPVWRYSDQVQITYGALARRAALLPKSTEGRMSRFPGQTYPTVSVTGTPSAVKPFRNERAKATGPREPANDSDLELGDLTVEVARHEALTQQFDTVHPIAGKTVPRTGFWPGSYLDAASAVIAFGAALGPVAGGPLAIVARWFDRSGVMRAGLRCAHLHPRCRASRAWRSCEAGVRARTPLVRESARTRRHLGRRWRHGICACRRRHRR